MENKEKTKITEIVERLTAEQYVVMQLQRAENTISQNKNILDGLERDNLILTKNNRALNKIVNFIFKHMNFYFLNDNDLYVAGHIKVEDTEIKQLIEKAIENAKVEEEE